jgi:hypothetical protein
MAWLKLTAFTLTIDSVLEALKMMCGVHVTREVKKRSKPII